MMLPASKEDEVFAVQVKGWHIVANGLDGVGGRFPYGLPHLFKDGSGVLWKGADVFINCREVLFVWHTTIIPGFMWGLLRAGLTESDFHQERS